MTRSRIRCGLIAGVAMVTFAIGYPAYAQENKLVAKVGTVEITEADLAIAMEIYADQIESMPDDAKRSMVVDALIDLRLVAQSARAGGLDQSDDYKRQLAFFENQTLRSLYMQAEVAKRIDDAAVRKAYDVQVAAVPPVEEFRVSHILFASESDASAAIAALKAGADFALMAKEKSLDQASKDKGGDLGFSEAGTSVAEIDAAVAGLAPGQIADKPAKTPFGFHVVRLEEKRTRPAPSFAELQPQLRQMLEAQAAQKIIAELRAATPVEKLVPDVRPPESEDGHEH